MTDTETDTETNIETDAETDTETNTEKHSERDTLKILIVATCGVNPRGSTTSYTIVQGNVLKSNPDQFCLFHALSHRRFWL